MSPKNEALDVKYYKDIKPKEIKWLWYPYIPMGKITIIQGDPGKGKSTFAINLCAMLTNGDNIPFSNEKMLDGNVIYQNNEDSKSDTIVPRLISSGADLNRIAYIDEDNNVFDLGCLGIEEVIEKTNAKLIVLDPIQAYLGKDTDMNRAGDIRPIMNRLAGLAERKGCAIVLIGHMSKNNGTKGLYRGLGSIDIPAVARSVLLISSLQTDDMKIMAQVKNNLAPLGDSIVFSFDNQSKINWLYKSKITAEQVLNDDYSNSISKTDRAVSIISESLSKGKCLVSYIEKLCEDEGISMRTIKNAKSRLNIKTTKNAEGWFWELAQ